MTAMPCNTLLHPSKDSIWQQQKQQVISRLAAKGIYISEDDPRLNLPPDDDCDHMLPNPTKHNASIKEAAESPVDHGYDLSLQSSSASSTEKHEQPCSRSNAADETQHGESLMIGKDPVSEASRRRQMKQTTRKLLEEQILEKQRRIEQERIGQRNELRPPMSENRNSAENGPHSLSSTALSSCSTCSILPSIDPVAEKQRRKKMQLEMSSILQQQMREKTIQERMAQISMSQDPSTSTSIPFHSCRTPQRLRSPEPGTSFMPSVSITALDRDPEKEISRRRKSQIDLNSALRHQIQEHQRRKSSDKLLSRGADLGSPFYEIDNEKRRSRRSLDCSSDQRSRSPLVSRSSEFPYRNAIPIGENSETPEALRQRQSEYAEALKLQMRERSKLSSPHPLSKQGSRLAHWSSESPYRSALPTGETVETPEVIRQRQREYAQALESQIRERRKSGQDDWSEQASKSPFPVRSSESPFRSALPIGEKIQTPEVIRQRQRDYAEALQRQMQERPSHTVDRVRNQYPRLAASFVKTPNRSGFPLGEQIESPEIIRQRQREYAEALHFQMLERKQRESLDKAKQDEEDRRREQSEGDGSKANPIRSSSPSQRGIIWRPCSRVSEGLLASASEDGLDDTGTRSTGDIFNHDPLKAAIAQKVQRRQLGEELQKQMEEQRRREEQRKLKEQQENLEDDNRLLKQIEEMNSSVRNEPSKLGKTGECRNDEPNDPRNHNSPQSKSPARKKSEDIPRQHSPVRTSVTVRDNLDWKQTEAECIQPLRQIRDKLALDSGELRQYIAEQRQRLQKRIVEPEGIVEDFQQLLPNVSSWLPVESDSEHQLPVKSEFVDVPASVSEKNYQGLNYQGLSDDDILERFVSESQLPSALSSAQPKRRSKWGTPVFPASMNESNESRPLTPSETILRSRSGFPGSNFSAGSD